jgi:GT2 family glycosyltransferase
MLQPELSVVIVTYNSSLQIKRAINSIFKSLIDLSFELIIVDNNSQDETISIVKNLGLDIILICNDSNIGFAKANNVGFKRATGKFILIYNPDLILTKDSNLLKLIGIYSMSNEIGLVAPRLYYENGIVQESVRGFPNPLAQMIRLLKLDKYFNSNKLYSKYLVSASQLEVNTYVDWVIGAFMLVRKELLFEIGLFDERYFMYMEDADLCLNLKKRGYKICYCPQFSAVHSYNRESSKKLFSSLKWTHIKSSLKFYAKHGFKFY